MAVLSKWIIEHFTEEKVNITLLISAVVLVQGLLSYQVVGEINYGFMSVFFLFLLVTAWIDALTFDVYDIINYIGLALGVLYHVVFGQGFIFSLMGFASGMIAFAAVYGVALLVYKQEAFGLGDVWILGVIGSFVGLKGVLLVAMASFYIAALYLIVLAFKNGKLDRKQRISFGPYICIAAFIYTLYGDELVQLYVNAFLR